MVPTLLLVFVLQCTWFIRTQSITNDEPEHIVAGLEAWRFGEFEHWHDQPPLARLLFTLPMIPIDWKYQLVDDQVHPVSPGPKTWLYRTRSVNVLFGIALLILVWATARRLFSEGTANFVLALAALSPDLIAHFSLATIDGVGCLFLFASIVQWMRYRRNPSWIQAAILGVLLGLLLLAKFNAPPLVLLMVLLVLVATPTGVTFRPRQFAWRRAAAIVLIACLVVWTGYFYHVSKVTFADQMVTIHFAGYTKLLQYEMPTLHTPITIFLPACEWMTGLGMVVVHNIEGHRSFLLGNYSTDGFKAYFPAAMALKWPASLLTMGLIGVFFVLRRKVAGARDLLLMSLFPAVYFLFAVTSRIDIGVRHVLPLYPFLLLYAGAVWQWASGRANAVWIKGCLVSLLALQAADIARYAPDYLSYFTVFVSPADTWQLLSDSNTDWGQGMVALKQYEDENPGETIHLAYVGEADPAWSGIRYIRMTEGDHPTGTVVVSAAHLSGQLLRNHSAYRWLLDYPLKAVLNHSLYVFEVPDGIQPSASQ